MQTALSYAKVFLSWWGLGLDVSFGQQVGCTDQLTTGTFLSVGRGWTKLLSQKPEGFSCRCPVLGHVHSGFSPNNGITPDGTAQNKAKYGVSSVKLWQVSSSRFPSKSFK